MCGIAGYFKFTDINADPLQLIAMSEAIKHRGPDDEGFVFAGITSGRSETYSSIKSPTDIKNKWPVLSSSRTVCAHNIAMSQGRYSIIDLSSAGHQPMWSSCGRACISFNGEVYNYIELREELIRYGYSFNTTSDTEVLLTGYLHWGEQVFSKIQGFFALAILDLHKKAVLIARDRLGKANLYFCQCNGKSIYWASEIKSLIASGCFDYTRIKNSAVADFINFGHRDRAGTFWEDVQDFPPAHFAWIAMDGKFSPQRYWSIPESRLTSHDISEVEASSGLRDVLTDALVLRMRADVPIAFELSGGMDSSALVGLAAGRLGHKLDSYTIEFGKDCANEEPFARRVAERYPDMINYNIINQSSDDFWREADQFVWLQEEPFHAPNLHTNQYLRRIMKEKGSHVVITGAAGDEMLGGYPHDYFAPFLRYLLGDFQLKQFGHELFTNSEFSAVKVFNLLVTECIFSEEIIGRLVLHKSGMYQILNKITPTLINLQSCQLPVRFDSSFHGRTLANMTYRMMNYWLRSGSKADYGIPIESRAPFLDHRVVEFCCQLPPEYLIKDGWHKHVLRKAVQEFLPEEVVWRKNKMGFPFPYKEWLISNREIIIRNSQGIDCPYVDVKMLICNYDKLVSKNPVMLWRIISVILWWRRVIEKQQILSSAV